MKSNKGTERGWGNSRFTKKKTFDKNNPTRETNNRKTEYQSNIEGMTFIVVGLQHGSGSYGHGGWTVDTERRYRVGKDTCT